MTKPSDNMCIYTAIHKLELPQRDHVQKLRILTCIHIYVHDEAPVRRVHALQAMHRVILHHLHCSKYNVNVGYISALRM